MKTKKALIILMIVMLASTAARAQWSGSGPRWNYNGRETMYVGPLQSGGQGFSFAYNWGRQAGNLGTIEFWPYVNFKETAEFEDSGRFLNSGGTVVVDVGDYESDGIILVNDRFGRNSVELWGQYQGGGINIFSPSGATLVAAGRSGSSDYGVVLVKDVNGTTRSGIQGNGLVWGSTKSFIVDHPVETNLMIRYTAIEGSSPDIYFSGTSTVTGGVAVVEYPEHFAVLAKSGTHTITVTPRSPQSKGLCVANRSDGGFVVAELFSGIGNYEFDFYVVAKRSGFDDYEVYLTKDDDATTAGKRAKSISSGPSFETKQSFKDVTGVSRKTQ